MSCCQIGLWLSLIPIHLEKQGLHINWSLFDRILDLLKTNGAYFSFLLTRNDGIVFVDRETVTSVIVPRKSYFFLMVMPLIRFSFWLAKLTKSIKNTNLKIDQTRKINRATFFIATISSCRMRITEVTVKLWLH